MATSSSRPASSRSGPPWLPCERPARKPTVSARCSTSGDERWWRDFGAAGSAWGACRPAPRLLLRAGQRAALLGGLAGVLLRNARSDARGGDARDRLREERRRLS